MSNTTNQMHADFLEEIREKVAQLEEQITTLRAVEKYHEEAMNGKHVTPASGGSMEGRTQDVVIAGDTKAERCESALKYLGRPASVPEISKLIAREEFTSPIKRRIYNNSLYNAMTRNEHIFAKKSGSPLWGLVEWNTKE